MREILVRRSVGTTIRSSASLALAVSDHGLGPETGKGTDFIVLTH